MQTAPKAQREPDLRRRCATIGLNMAACLIALRLLAAAVLAAEPQGTPPTCWTPAMLQGSPVEKAPKKGIRTFDLPLPNEPVAAPASRVAPGVVRRVTLKGDRKLIALTFDLCEQTGEIAGYDGAVVDYLRKAGVKATFFAGGKWLRSHEERARQLLADPLFEIGNHTEAHRNLRRLTGERLSNEILGPQRSYVVVRAALAQAQCMPPEAMSRIPAVPTLFRFPYGACNAAALDAVSKAGLTAIQWDVSSGDPDPHASAQAIAETILRRARPGSIVVSHANGRGWHTAEALPLVVPKLRAKGYEFVTVSELLAAGEPVVEQRCYDNKPGDTDRYDFLLAHRARRATPSSPESPWSPTLHQ
jgi:peptidoglycan/xylan/chitin deacetylase (PgdA/CDA1 family)